MLLMRQYIHQCFPWYPVGSYVSYEAIIIFTRAFLGIPWVPMFLMRQYIHKCFPWYPVGSSVSYAAIYSPVLSLVSRGFLCFLCGNIFTRAFLGIPWVPLFLMRQYIHQSFPWYPVGSSVTYEAIYSPELSLVSRGFLCFL